MMSPVRPPNGLEAAEAAASAPSLAQLAMLGKPGDVTDHELQRTLNRF